MPCFQIAYAKCLSDVASARKPPAFLLLSLYGQGGSCKQSFRLTFQSYCMDSVPMALPMTPALYAALVHLLRKAPIGEQNRPCIKSKNSRIVVARACKPCPATLCAALLATLNAGVCADPVKTPQSQNISANVFSMDASIHLPIFNGGEPICLLSRALPTFSFCIWRRPSFRSCDNCSWLNS